MKSGTLIHRLITLTTAVLTASLAMAGAPGEPREQNESSEPVSELNGFHAEYKLKYSMFSGTVVLDLRPTENSGEYIYEVDTRAGGIARVIISGEAKERTQFSYANGRVQPVHYYLNDGLKKDDSETDIRFDWPAATAHIKHAGKSLELEIETGTLDRLSTDISAILELRAGRIPGDYPIIDEDSITVYGYEFLGEERIKVPAGEFQTLKYKRQRPGSSRNTLIWFAPEADYLPVRVEQQKRGKTVITSKATVVKLQP
jgi:hypothetical protein